MYHFLLSIFYYLAHFIGLIFIFLYTKNIISFLYSKFLRIRKDFINIYGKDTWVLVTGASDGIGKAFCLEFARIGFNVCLLGRSKLKLELVEDEVKKINPNIKTQMVIADLSDALEEDLFLKINEQTKNIDISILVNNAGVGNVGKFIDLTVDKLKEMVVVNSYAPMMMMKNVIPKMLSRPKRSAIINVASVAAILPCSNWVTYSASKAFLDHLTRSLALECSLNPDNNKIDLMSLRPCWVSTKMVGYKKVEKLTITPKDCVNGCLNDLGYETFTAGSWKHALDTFLKIKNLI